VGETIPANSALNIPSHKLKSSRLYTQTYAPAFKRSPGRSVLTNSKVRVVPNPYIISAELKYDKPKVVFVNLTGECTIQIYSELGELIQTLEHNDGSGSEDWPMTTSSNQFIVSGIYIGVITDSNTGDKVITKFSIIR
jgi:hypothetical protein